MSRISQIIVQGPKFEYPGTGEENRTQGKIVDQKKNTMILDDKNICFIRLINWSNKYSGTYFTMFSHFEKT